MGRTMFVSLSPTARASTATPFSDSPEAHAPEIAQRAWYLRGRWLLSLWAILSVMWGLAVGYDVYLRVSTQAEMARDVENDLDRGFVTESCADVPCGVTTTNAARTQNWSRIASTYIKFGSNEMAESLFGPPAVLLVIGLGTVFVLHRRPAKANRTQISKDN